MGMEIFMQKREISGVGTYDSVGLGFPGAVGRLGNWVRDIERVLEKCKEFSTVSNTASTQEREEQEPLFFFPR